MTVTTVTTTRDRSSGDDFFSPTRARDAREEKKPGVCVTSRIFHIHFPACQILSLSYLFMIFILHLRTFSIPIDILHAVK